jgi:hypothetical protein
MCLVCSAVTQNPACNLTSCPISMWQQNLNLIAMTVSPILGGIYVTIKNLWKK